MGDWLTDKNKTMIFEWSVDELRNELYVSFYDCDAFESKVTREEKGL